MLPDRTKGVDAMLIRIALAAEEWKVIYLLRHWFIWNSNLVDKVSNALRLPHCRSRNYNDYEFLLCFCPVRCMNLRLFTQTNELWNLIIKIAFKNLQMQMSLLNWSFLYLISLFTFVSTSYTHGVLPNQKCSEHSKWFFRKFQATKWPQRCHCGVDFKTVLIWKEIGRNFTGRSVNVFLILLHLLPITTIGSIFGAALFMTGANHRKHKLPLIYVFVHLRYFTFCLPNLKNSLWRFRINFKSDNF